MQIFLVIAVVVFGFIALWFFLSRALKRLEHPQQDQSQLIAMSDLNKRIDDMSSNVNTALRDTLKVVGEQLREARDASERATRYMGDQLKEVRESSERSSKTVFEQVQGFTSGITALQEHVKQMQEHVKGVASFQDVFRSPKLRGIWGESSLESSLEQYFAPELYELQHSFKDNVIVDAILKLPNDLILPIDAKFNFENFEKIANAETEAAKDQYRKLFYTDVKKKIDEIATKYILPGESTTDFALMYIPAETVYYEIISHMKDMDVPGYARSKRVFIVSPNTFALSISAIRHWVKDIQVNKQTQEIMKKLGRISMDGQKLGDEFRKLGKHISDASSAYASTEKRVDLMVDRVQKVMELGGDEQPQIETRD